MIGRSRYIGEAATIIDAKNRITLPAKFRSKLPTSPDGSIVLLVAPGPDYPSLEIFDAESGARRMDELVGESGLPDEEQRRRQEVLGQIEYCECDKQGRLLLPAKHVAYAKLTGEVRVSGRGSYLLLFSPEQAKASGRLIELESLEPAAIGKLYEQAKKQGIKS